MRITAPKAPKPALAHFPPRWGQTVLVILPWGVLALLLGFIYPDGILSTLRDLTVQRTRDIAGNLGHHALQDRTYQPSLKEALISAPWIKWAFGTPNIPKLYVDIKFKHLQMLQRQRKEALRIGILLQRQDSFIPAQIRVGARTVKIKLRLKGDWTDHLEGDKWSFRIRTDGLQPLFGLRRFSIQHPKTRGFQGESLIQETMRAFDVLVPQYFFVDVAVNGDDIGLMAVEEAFSKELLERNGRKEGVIIRFDESLLWEFRARGAPLGHGPFEGHYNAPIDAFQSAKIEQSERLKSDYAVAAGLLKGFVKGHLSASEVFDVDRMGSYLAVAQFWGSDHDVIWHNQRFYLNPLTMKLEPIAFDATLNIRRPPGYNIVGLPLTELILKDPRIAESFEESMKRIVAIVQSGELAKRLQAVEAPLLDALQHEFALLREFDVRELEVRAEQLPDWHVPPLNPEIYPLYVYAYRIRSDNQECLELSNALPLPVDVIGIDWSNLENEARPFEPNTPMQFPLSFNPTPLGTISNSRWICFTEMPSEAGYAIRIKAKIRGYDFILETRARTGFVPLNEPPIPTATLADALANHPFLRAHRKQRALEVVPGIWPVRGDLVLPNGWALHVVAGTTLRFEPEASLVVHGPTRLSGTSDQPIVLEGLDSPSKEPGTWEGTAILHAKTRSEWSHVQIRNTTGVKFPQWILTGGVTFYKSDVDLIECNFEGNRGEDALNIVHSDLKLDRIQIKNTASDAFDGDFVTGIVSGGRFEDIGTAGGGDAVDVSGSTLEVHGTRFERVHDKAISVGEGSSVVVGDIEAVDCSVGAASKDGSTLKISSSSIQRAGNIGLMSYMKKQEYGPAQLFAHKVRIEETKEPVQAQRGNVLELNGKRVSTEALDVDELYQTTMKSGLRNAEPTRTP